MENRLGAASVPLAPAPSYTGSLKSNIRDYGMLDRREAPQYHPPAGAVVRTAD